MKKALVIGGARSGKYIALLLNENNYDVTLTDINPVDFKDEFKKLNIKVVDNGHPDSLLDTKYDLVVKNPGIKYTVAFIQKVLAQGYKIYNEVEVALNYLDNTKVYAISGTNGKTTTVSQLYEMLKSKYPNTYLGGNIGTAISELVYLKKDIDHLVIELSSFQLDGMYDFHPNFANLTNLKEDHLDYYEKIEDYFNSKQKIYQNQNENDYLLVNKDDKLVLKYLNNPKAKVITYSIEDHADVYLKGDDIIFGDIVLFNINELSLVGKHNIYNAIVAALMAYLSGVDLEMIQMCLKTFKAVEHRIEYVKTVNDISYYNDSKSTNSQSLIVALEAFDKEVILIAGGYDKNVSFDELIPYVKNVKKAILFGETKEKLAKVFTNNEIVADLEAVFGLLSNIATKDDIVLFSPACASFDQYKNYEERGIAFKNLVNKIKSDE